MSQMPAQKPIDAHTGAHIYTALGSLASRLDGFEDVAAVLRDGEITVVGRASQRGDVITCKPWDDDGGTLWFFNTHGQAIIEAANIIDAAVLIAGRLRAER